MFPFDLVLAAALLTAHPDSPEPSHPPANYEQLQPLLQALAVQWEILDPREVRYVLTRSEDYASDIKLLRRRFQDLSDAPPLVDCHRFPDRSAISDLLTFNRAYRQHLDSCMNVELVRWWELREALQETDRIYNIYDTVRDARCDYYYITVRRQALKRLRELLGDEAYCTAALPPHVPIWRFQRID